MFFYPSFDKHGKKVLCSTDGVGKEMLMNIAVYQLSGGQEQIFFHKNEETAILLIEGEIRIECDEIDEKAIRSDPFNDLPTTLHACKGKEIKITALSDARIICQSTQNERIFPTKLYRKEDVVQTVSCEGLWENTAVRDVNTIFDYDIAPYSNMVIGEVLARQGRWWSYVPHSHPQPEVYYYEFSRPEGFGACFIGETAYTVKNGSCGCFEGGNTHVQVTAPGFPMYNVWMIRHLDGNPWKKTRIVDPRYTWLESECKFIPKK